MGECRFSFASLEMKEKRGSLLTKVSIRQSAAAAGINSKQVQNQPQAPSLALSKHISAPGNGGRDQSKNRDLEERKTTK